MKVQQIVNETLTSNTYIISSDNSNSVWLIDIGNIYGVLETLSLDSNINGVFLTHPHFDHICGINKLIESFSKCIVYTSEEGKIGLASAKLNLSFYREEPIEYCRSNFHILKEKDQIKLFNGHFLETFETPGHNWGCLTLKIDNYLFTGDSYIPGIDVVTKLKGGDREANTKSLQIIKDNITEQTIICPGHGAMTQIANEI